MFDVTLFVRVVLIGNGGCWWFLVGVASGEERFDDVGQGEIHGEGPAVSSGQARIE